ncbi:hypothetical protein BMS3Bbin10_02383 [bacterium BMS3Bbin10]|nr:hypothetical protein BMS3Bbin10_02383 [bacterium BMS3Bbin10]
MATSASWELQKGIYQTLAADTSITGLLGGTNIYDDAPQSADYPYLTFGQSVARDWSTGSEDGLEHILTLHVWSRAGGKKETHEIIEAIRQALHDAAVTVNDHALVNLRHEFSEARQDPDGEIYHGIVRYRAVTEPLAA